MNHQEHQGHQGPSREARYCAPDRRCRSAYEHCLAHELDLRGIAVRRQVALPIAYEGLQLDAGYRLDLVVADRVIVEVKAVEAMSRLFEAQLLTYLKLSGLRLGVLMNFNVPLFKDGVRRLAL